MRGFGEQGDPGVRAATLSPRGGRGPRRPGGDPLPAWREGTQASGRRPSPRVEGGDPGVRAVTLSLQVLAGQGIDRHLLGLKLAAIGDGQRLPGIFMDTAYAIATHCRLLTGQVASRSDCLMIYGPQVPDGYGVCYNPLDAHVNFAITAFNCCRETHAQRLAHTLQGVLDQLARLLGESPGGAGGDVEGQP
ncbi:carnitine O-acetyltransferase-like [Pangshura tecta]